MPRKCLLTQVVARVLIIGLLTLVSPVVFAAAPVQGQQDTSMGEQSTISQAIGWFAGVWEKLLVWLPDPTAPTNTTQSSAGEDPDLGPAIEPNGGS